MSVDFSYYVTVKNHYCLCYFGQSLEYPILLRAFRRSAKKTFPDLRVFICVADNLYHLVETDEDVLSQRDLRDRKNTFAHIREITITGTPPHPVLALAQESGIKLDAVPSRPFKRGKCLICPDGGYPTGTMTDVEEVRRVVRESGYEPVVVGSDVHQNTPGADVRPSGSDRFSILDGATRVIGVENEYLFEAGFRGIPVTLISTGIGTDLFKALFPAGEVVKV